MIVQYKDGLENPIYPRTSLEAVIDGNGHTLKELLEGGLGVSGVPTVDFGLPVSAAKVSITCAEITADASDNSITLLTTSQNSVGVLDDADKDMAGKVVDENGDVHCNMTVKVTAPGVDLQDYCAISYQGQTSLGHPKKNFTIDFLDKHKFGRWLEFDSFHLKGYYVDWMHSRDWVANRLWEQLCLSKSVTERRPYFAFNDFNNDYRQRNDMGVLCHVDAFPVELYINGVYWGLYTWRLKKHRDNYFLGKSDVKHIQLDPSTLINFDSFAWSQVEIRNPKSDSGNTSFPEGQEPNPGEVKTAILAFVSAISSATTKADFEAILNIDSTIDYLVYSDFICAWDILIRNTLWTTWDAEHFSLLPYDLDSSFGYGYTNTTDWSSTLIPANTDVFTFYKEGRTTIGAWFDRFRTLYKNEIAERYFLYRSKGVFTVQNVMELFSSFSTWVGQGVYKKDLGRWDYPTNGYGEHGFKDSLERVQTFMESRVGYLDMKYSRP